AIECRGFLELSHAGERFRAAPRHRLPLLRTVVLPDSLEQELAEERVQLVGGFAFGAPVDEIVVLIEAAQDAFRVGNSRHDSRDRGGEAGQTCRREQQLARLRWKSV